MIPSIQIDAHQVSARLRDLPRQIQRAVTASLNRTMAMARTQADRVVRDEYAVRFKDLRQAVSRTTATAIRPSSSIMASARGIANGGKIPLIAFATRQTPGGRSRQGGVKVRVRKNEAPTLYRHAFIARTTRGRLAVVQRAYRGRTKVLQWYQGYGPHRGGPQSRHPTAELPFIELLGPSIVALYGQRAVAEVIQRTIEEQYPRLLAHNVAFFRSGK